MLSLLLKSGDLGLDSCQLYRQTLDM